MPIRIALLEDDPDQAKILIAAIESTSAFKIVGPFGTVREFQASREVGTCEAAVVDVHLPDGSGIEVIRSMRQLYPSLRCLVFTVAKDSFTIFTALQAGASGYLNKTGDPKGIVQRLTEVLSGELALSPGVARWVMLHFQETESAVAALGGAGLTPAETRTLGELTRGLSYDEIAEKFDVSLSTVRTHIQHIYDKLGVRSRGKAAEIASRAGLGRGTS